jgi:predicted acyltransferase
MNKDLLTLRNIWLMLDGLFILIGLYLFIWVPVNKKIWSISYMFVVAGISGSFFTLFFIIIDIWKVEWFEKYFIFLLWLGMNPLAIYMIS